MKAYKFRAANQVGFALDIILEQRLYCADWKSLNDPMEGMFAYSRRAGQDESLIEARVKEITEGKVGLKVCSLSATFDCHLLWAHYAGGFDGMAIEVEVPATDNRIKTVSYRGVFAAVNDPMDRPASEVAEEILSSKYQEWAYEKEVRVLQRDMWYRLASPVSRVIVGHRMPTSLVRALQIICERENIPIRRTGIGDEGIDADVIE